MSSVLYRMKRKLGCNPNDQSLSCLSLIKGLKLLHDYFILGQLNLQGNEDYNFNNELRYCDEETNLCPDGFCCVWEQKQCISQEDFLMIGGGSCNDISSSTDENDVIPDYLCDAQHPCPQNFCCLSNLATCVSQVKIQLIVKITK